MKIQGRGVNGGKKQLKILGGNVYCCCEYDELFVSLL